MTETFLVPWPDVKLLPVNEHFCLYKFTSCTASCSLVSGFSPVELVNKLICWVLDLSFPSVPDLTSCLCPSLQAKVLDPDAWFVDPRFILLPLFHFNPPISGSLHTWVQLWLSLHSTLPLSPACHPKTDRRYGILSTYSTGALYQCTKREKSIFKNYHDATIFIFSSYWLFLKWPQC